MSAALALAAAEAAGIRISVDGDDLVLDADTPPPPDVLGLLAENKLGIIALLRSERRGTELPIPAESAAAAIPPATVQIAFTAIFERLTIDHSRAPETARAGAMDHLRIALRCDPRLFPSQPDLLRCVTCCYPEMAGPPLVAVLTGLPDEHRWLHAGICHDEYRRRLSALADAAIASAGLV